MYRWVSEQPLGWTWQLAGLASFAQPTGVSMFLMPSMLASAGFKRSNLPLRAIEPC